MFATTTKAIFVFFLLVAACVSLVDAAPIKHSMVKRCTHAGRAAQAISASASSSASAAASSSTKAATVLAASNSTKSDDASDDSSASKSNTASAAGAESVQALFPLGSTGSSWTTSSSADGSLPLSDDTLKPTKDMKQLSHNVVKAPDGSEAMEALYPKGSMNPGNEPVGGISFYGLGPDSMDLTTAKEVTFGYSVFFEDGFEWVKGGKLPGMYGGDSAEQAVSCSGGRRDDSCFSARLMWRAEGKGEFYTYLPPSEDANKKVCNVAPESDCNDVYGASVGRGAFDFTPGAWTTVSERIRLNDVGKENGSIELFVNGESKISVDGLVLRTSEDGKFRGFQMQTFFGGSHDGFQAVKDSKTWFKDFSMAITDTF